MEKLLELAKKFLEENPGINEVELSDGFGNTVRVARNVPYVGSVYPAWTPVQTTGA